MAQTQSQTNNRNSSIELLRIIAMIMIVFHHFAVHGGFEWATTAITIPRFWYNFILMGGKIGVDIFVIISGYYLITDKRRLFDPVKILKFVGQVVFYSVAMYIVFGVTGISDTGILSFVKSWFPLTFSHWWFASAYFVLYLLHPFLNTFLQNLDKSVYRKFLLAVVVFWSVIPTLTTSSFQGNSLLWFITLYSIAGYVRLYGLNEKFMPKHYFIFAFIVSVLTYLSNIILTVLGAKWSIFASLSTYFYGQEKLNIVIISLCLFMGVVKLKMKYHKWINVIASTTFGVYLIHDNSIIHQFLWGDIFKNAQYQESLLLIPYSVLVVIIVHGICSIIDLLRQHIIEKPFMMVVKRASEIKIGLFEKITDVLRSFIFGMV